MKVVDSRESKGPRNQKRDGEGSKESLRRLECGRMSFRRIATFFLTLVISTVWLIPTAIPGAVADAQTLGQGYSVAGDFKGAGYQQIATLYDPGDDLGLRIAVLDRTTTEAKMVATQWFLAGASSFDL